MKKITKRKRYSEPNDIMVVLRTIIIFIVAIWLFSPPLNKIIQIMYWYNNTKLFFAKVSNPNLDNEYEFYRHNAYYLAKMYPKRSSVAIDEIKKAIRTLPPSAGPKQKEKLIEDKARIELYLREKDAAIEDFAKLKRIRFDDMLPYALLLLEKKQYTLAAKQCYNLRQMEYTNFIGYACLAEVYKQAKMYDKAIDTYKWSLDRRKNNFWAYLEMAKVKNISGDHAGAEKDYRKAEELAPRIKRTDSYFDDMLAHRKFNANDY